MPVRKSTTVNLTPAAGDATIIVRIVSRWRKLGAANAFPVDALSTSMDITAVHLNDTPLDLQKLLDFDDGNLMHDIFGIANCLDRTTGRLGKNFRPRCARPEAA
jgi:hypothetical protein